MKNTLGFLFYLLLFSLFYGCGPAYDATIKTYVNPSFKSSTITSVAVFPLRNAFVQQNVSLGTGDLIEINKMFQLEFANKNSRAQMLNSISSSELLNKFNLVNSYDTLLTVYGNTGIPNTQILNRIGQNLKVDAIIQGFVVGVSQRDGVFAMGGSTAAETKIIVKYVMFSTISGIVIWEATCEAYKQANAFSKAPPVSEVIDLIREKLITGMPTL